MVDKNHIDNTNYLISPFILIAKQIIMSSLNTDVSEKEAHIAYLEARIAENNARTAEIEARTAEIEARTAEIEARTAEIEARIAVLKKIQTALDETERKAKLLLPQGCSQAARTGFF